MKAIRERERERDQRKLQNIIIVSHSFFVLQAGVPVFAWKGETLEEYWETTWEALHFSDNESCQLLVDDGGDATLLIHRGYEVKQKNKQDSSFFFKCFVFGKFKRLRATPPFWTSPLTMPSSRS